jgi:CheY-like chemotaxis protein
VGLDEILSLRYLIVDDDARDLNALYLILIAMGVHYIEVATGHHNAIAKLRASATRIDCIICDYAMPGGTALHLLRSVRRGLFDNVIRPDGTFVVVSSLISVDVTRFAQDLDANGYVLKPLKPSQLYRDIASARRNVRSLKSEASYRIKLPLPPPGVQSPWANNHQLICETLTK